MLHRSYAAPEEGEHAFTELKNRLQHAPALEKADIFIRLAEMSRGPIDVHRKLAYYALAYEANPRSLEAIYGAATTLSPDDTNFVMWLQRWVSLDRSNSLAYYLLASVDAKRGDHNSAFDRIVEGNRFGNVTCYPLFAKLWPNMTNTPAVDEYLNAMAEQTVNSGKLRATLLTLTKELLDNIDALKRNRVTVFTNITSMGDHFASGRPANTANFIHGLLICRMSTYKARDIQSPDRAAQEKALEARVQIRDSIIKTDSFGKTDRSSRIDEFNRLRVAITKLRELSFSADAKGPE